MHCYDHIRIICISDVSHTNCRGSWVTNYEVKVGLEGSLLKAKTEDFVNTASCRTQNEPDQYGTVWIEENIDKVCYKRCHVS